MGSRRTSGIRAASAVLLVAALGGCYTFQGGGGFPAHIRTLYVEPLEVDPTVTRVDLRQDLYNLLLDRVPRALGVQSAGAESAGAVLRVRILRYNEVGLGARQSRTDRQAVEVPENQIEIAVAVELVDVRENLVLWDSRSVIGKGTYLRESQTEQEGQAQALQNIVQLIIDGAQSQW
ncbi:MAG TPA: LPS assembly lipoprotein LptE [Longimicrobiales bacterium]|nr:LPS assembly lipoprotein LptE [Longimicrobiales bacterium]